MFSFLENINPNNINNINNDMLNENLNHEKEEANLNESLKNEKHEQKNSENLEQESNVDDFLQNFLKNKESLKSEIDAFLKEIKKSGKEMEKNECAKAKSDILNKFQISTVLAKKENNKTREKNEQSLLFDEKSTETNKIFQSETLSKDIEEMTSATKHNKIDEEFKNFYKAIELKNQENNDLFNKIFQITPSMEQKNLLINAISPRNEQKNEKLRNLTFSPSLLLDEPEFSICDKTFLKSYQEESDENEHKGKIFSIK
jgi:hypothetical protein